MKKTDLFATIVFWLVAGPLGMLLGGGIAYAAHSFSGFALGVAIFLLTIAGIILAIKKARRQA